MHPPELQRIEVPHRITFDAIMPADMALRAEESGIKRISTDHLTLLILSFLGGAFISFGAIFATTVSAGSITIAASGVAVLSAQLPYGVVRLLAGVAFSLGFILVVVAGAELFTGNNLIVMAWANRRIKTRDLLLNWTITFSGNIIGAVLTAGLMFYTGQYTFADGAVGLAALTTADVKVSHGIAQTVALGMMCNALVCLASWMCYSARTTVEKIFIVILPIAAFVASGFEHSIANAYFIPVALFIKYGATASFWTSIGKTASAFPSLTWYAFFIDNLIPVTIGNVIGGSAMVGSIYWFIYLRKR